MSHRSPPAEPLPVYTKSPDDEVPAPEPPTYVKRTPSQEAIYIASLKSWAEERSKMNAGAYMETFYIGDKTVFNGQLVPSESSETAAHHAAADGRASHDKHGRDGLGRRISGFLKKISPAERAEQKALALSDEEWAENQRKFPMSEGSYSWENYKPSEKRA